MLRGRWHRTAPHDCVLRAAALRSKALHRLVETHPTCAVAFAAFPVKLANAGTCAAALAVVYATDPTPTARTFGAAACCVGASISTFGLRAHADASLSGVFSPIMLGTPRQKMRVLHAILQVLSAALLGVGAGCVGAARLRDCAGAQPCGALWPAAVTADAALRAAPQHAACAVALSALAVQVAAAAGNCSPGRCFGREFHAAFGPFAHDAVCLAQAIAVQTSGVASLATTLVALLLVAVWLANAVQMHKMDGDLTKIASDAPYTADVAISFSV
ncbi:hypothetical protein M885DRAFT_547612 [Pelagophyceae sp. CCMP2097]|nr:hypothetical protein M885DRAFT_547612 [Pelagophyceae sp. CCMP2097]|mmetsp:Transcript_28920/g.99697  ORF Transcript_28920/g.99697 Transcript_28920/m.99697 type:complete len:274 (+) Transcript_28920:154-975(+)